MSEPRLPTEIGGRYRPIRLLGKGGMGIVYEVEHLHTGQHLALKVLTPQPGASVERFKREARAASRIHSENIVRVTDADVAPELDGAPFLVMDLLEGTDLERATGDRPASPAQVIEWMRQVARGLAKAHDAGIVHRDLKPENLFLTKREDGSPLVKILDFGIAKLAVETTALTASDTFLGTPGYMAPEQTDSRGPPVTHRADLFTLGLIAFKLLTGRLYWKSGSLAQLLAQILAEPMAPPSERGSTHGPAFDAWFARACHRQPEKRFGSAREQVEALAAALNLPAEALRPSDPSAGRTVTPSSGETQGSASLNGSFTDLTTARRRTARRRIYRGGLAAGLLAAALSIAMFRAGAPGRARTSAENAGLGAAAPPPASPVPAPVPSVSASPPLASASAAIAPLPVEVPGPVSSAVPAASGPKRKVPVASSSARAPAGADASPRHDPLEGPW
jgi:serine/threonine-protein kinase